MKRLLNIIAALALALVMVGPAWAVSTPMTTALTSPDFVDVIVRNVCYKAAVQCTMAPGDVVVWVPEATNPGVDVSKMDTADNTRIAGVIVGDTAGNSTTIASGEYARMRIFGYYAFVRTTGSPVINATLGASTTAGVAAAGNGLGQVIKTAPDSTNTNLRGVMIRTMGNWAD